MAHASSSWQNALIRTLERLLLPSAATRVGKASSHGSAHSIHSRSSRTPHRSDRTQRNALLVSGGWWLALPFATVLMIWHPELLLATLAGTGTMLGVYLTATSDKTIDWVAVSRLGDRLRQPVLLAIGAGAIVSLLVYVSLAIWGATENHWVASGLIAQGAATLAVLTILVWQTLTRLTGRDRVDLMPMLLQVADENGLKRTIAIRQIGQWIEQRRLDRAERKSVAACLQYLLGRETDGAIREAALDVLQHIQLLQERQESQQKSRSAEPFQSAYALDMATGEPIAFDTQPAQSAQPSQSAQSARKFDQNQRDAHISR